MHSPAAELVRSHLLPGTVSRFVLTAFDRVHGVGIVVSSVGLCNEPVWVRGVAPRRFWWDASFRRRFGGRDRELGGRVMGLRRAAGRHTVGRDPGPRRGVLVGWLASLDAVQSVGLVGERCPAGARAVGGCWRRVGCAAPCVPAGSRQVVENAGLRLLWGWAKPGCVGAARVALACVYVGSAASRRRIPILNT